MRRVCGFALVELLVVIGIITLLLGILLPAMLRARKQAQQIVCESNMHGVGMLLLMYANESQGWMFPVGAPKSPGGVPTTFGTNVPRDQRWPVYVFHPAVWNPPLLRCPGDLDPAEDHSYVLNRHLSDHRVRYSTSQLGGLDSTQVVVMGEKITICGDYYMERAEFDRVVEQFRHGRAYGSNYLYLDLHVSTTPPGDAMSGTDPWDPPLPPVVDLPPTTN